MEVDAAYTEQEFYALMQEDDPVMLGAEPPPSLRDLVGFGKPFRVFLHLYSGPRRHSDLQFYIESLAESSSFVVVAISLDVQVHWRSC